LRVYLNAISQEVLKSVFYVDQARVRAYKKFLEEDLGSEDSLELEFEGYCQDDINSDNEEPIANVRKETKPVQPWIIEKLIQAIEEKT